MIMKLCLIIQELGAGGSERVLTELASFFSQRKGAEIHVIVASDNQCFYSLPPNISIHSFGKGINGIMQRIKFLFFLNRTVIKIKPDAILSFGVILNMMVLFVLYLSKVPVYVSDRNSPLYHLSKIRFLLKKYLYKKAAGIVCQTQYSKQVLQSYIHHSNIVVIPNPIKSFVGIEGESKRNIIINVGRLIKSKRQDKLMDIFASIEADDWELMFVGSGEMREYYINYAQNLGIIDRVHFVEANNELQYYLAQSKIFAFTSETEGFPNALGEAMFYPLPCISFDCIAGPRDLIDDGVDGFLVPMNDEEMYAKKLKMLMVDEKLRNAFQKHALRKKARFGIETIGEKFYEVITKRSN